jgi:CHAT domain-containing protein
MGTLRLAALMFILLVASSFTYSQLWKQYADSAKILKVEKKYDSAIQLYTKAKEELKRDSALTNSYAGICDTIANIYQNISQYKKAEPFYVEAKEVREKAFGKMNVDYAASCNNLGFLYHLIDQFNKAELLYMEAQDIQEKVLGKESAEYALSCYNLGILYNNLSKFEKAESFLLEAKEIREKVLGREHLDYAASCNALAVFYAGTGKFEKAEGFYLEKKEITEKVLGKENKEFALICNNLASLYQDMGQYERADTLYTKAREIFARTIGKEAPLYALSCLNLAILYNITGEYEKCEPLYFEALSVWEKTFGREQYWYAVTTDYLAAFYMDIGEYKKAEPLALEARQMTEKALGKDHPYYAASCNHLALLHKNLGHYKEAESLFVEAKQIREKLFGKEHPDYIESCINLANLYFKLNEAEKANELYSEAYKSQNIRLKKIFKFTSEAEQQLYIKKVADFRNYFLSFTSTHPDYDDSFMYDVSLSSRSVILSSAKQLRKIIFSLNDTITGKKYNNWISLREQIAFWHSKLVAEQPDHLNDLEEQANILEKELNRISSAFQQEQQQGDVTWRTIQQNLKPDEAAIEFAKLHFYDGSRWTDSTYYIALLLTKKAGPKFISLFENDEFTAYKTVTALYTRTKGTNAAYNLIWKPIEKHLSGVKKIYFAPAGLLYGVSLQALPANDTETLSDKYQLIQLNTTASIANQSENFINPSDKIYLYGGIQYDADSVALRKEALAYSRSEKNKSYFSNDLTRGSGNGTWQYLPNTEKEINEIKNLGTQKNYTITVLSGTKVTEESIKGLNGNTSPAVLHIATHGFFFPEAKEEKGESDFGTVFRQSDNPLFRSGLLFAGANYAWRGHPIEGMEDGILTAYEVSNLYLPNTKLVVLSACETALGEIKENEGVYGLQRAFKIAGVENLIMSLWKVPDKETSQFMQSFYKNIFDHQSIDDAFYKAQTTMKNKYRKEPFKWAAWILVK